MINTYSSAWSIQLKKVSQHWKNSIQELAKLMNVTQISKRSVTTLGEISVTGQTIQTDPRESNASLL